MESWAEGDRYELYMGRWSARLAPAFLAWVDAGTGASWLDVGCGTGALAAAIVDRYHPSRLAGIDTSAEFIATARSRLGDQADLRVGNAQALPFPSSRFDAAVSALCLNFVPDPATAVREMQRATRRGGIVAASVWDYADGMQMIRRFWDVATELDPTIAHLDEAIRFPLCRPEPLATLFAEAGLEAVETTSLEIRTTFASFDGYWRPFLGGQGPAPTYVASLDETDRQGLATALRRTLPTAPGGAIDLTARSWAVKGVVSRIPG